MLCYLRDTDVYTFYNGTSWQALSRTVGGEIRCTAATRPTGAALYDGLRIYETDTKRHWRYDGANWVFMGGNAPRVEARRSGSPQAIPAGIITPWIATASSGSGDGMWSAGQPTRFVAPVSGVYAISWWMQFGSGSSAGDRQGFITVNSAGVGGGDRYAAQFIRSTSAADNIQISSSCQLGLYGGNYIELNLYSQQATSVCPNSSANDGAVQMVWVSAFS